MFKCLSGTSGGKEISLSPVFFPPEQERSAWHAPPSLYYILPALIQSATEFSHHKDGSFFPRARNCMLWVFLDSSLICLNRSCRNLEILFLLTKSISILFPCCNFLFRVSEANYSLFLFLTVRTLSAPPAPCPSAPPLTADGFHRLKSNTLIYSEILFKLKNFYCATFLVTRETEYFKKHYLMHHSSIKCFM